MALLKNYDNLQKNLQTARSSKGWADEQVGLQYETISRQLKALTADFQQMIITLDQAGASAGINTLIQVARELVQILGNINPENIRLLAETATTLAGMTVLFKLGTALSAIRVGLTGIIPMLRALPAILRSTAAGITSLGTAIRLVSKMTGIIGVALMAAEAVYTLYEAWSSFNDNESIRNVAKQTQELTQATDGLIQETSDLAGGAVDNINKYVNAMKESTDVLNSATATQQQKDEANKVLTASEKALTDMIGDSAVQRIKASGYSKEAIEQEIDTYTKMQITSNAVMQSRIQDEINTTQAVIESSQLRINQYQREMDSLYKLTRMRFEEARNAYNDYKARFSGKEDTFLAKMVKVDVDRKIAASKEATERMAKVIEEKGRYQAQNESATIQMNKLNMLKNGVIPKTSLNNDYIKGAAGGITDNGSTGDSKGSKGSKSSSGGSGSNKDYTEQLKRNELQTKRNELWYEASIQAKQYENTLKSITNDESYYGTTVASIMAKSNIYGERSKQLEDYQKKLEDFRTQLQNELSQKMQANPQLMQATKYTVDMKGEELTKNIEVNKELYQQSKTVSNIINMISAVNQKLEETKSKSIDIANEQRKIADEISKQKISDIEQQASIDKAKINRPTNFDYSKQANQIELEAERAKLAQYEADLENTIQEIEDKRYTASMKDMSALYKKQQTEIQLVEETKAKVAQLEYEKNSTIRQGLYDVTQQFLIQGNSLRDIWNNLWKDLAREALQRLFQIQAQASILGSLFGWSGGSSGKAITAGAGATKSISLPNYASVHSHTGSNVTGFKKMHTGGMVEQGRLGVVPKLKSDEVIRTLQIGEEVNSVSDRRSNEILATVAMKAIDSRNQQPNNINIMAIDSRSFAEYLNDNADVLLAVLNKQGALGRR